MGGKAPTLGSAWVWALTSMKPCGSNQEAALFLSPVSGFLFTQG